MNGKASFNQRRNQSAPEINEVPGLIGADSDGGRGGGHSQRNCKTDWYGTQYDAWVA